MNSHHCDFFTECGGCPLWQIPVEEQRLQKGERLGKALADVFQQKISVENIGQNFLPATAYRNRLSVTFSVNPHKKNEVICGLNKKGSARDVVDINHCSLVLPEINRAYQHLRALKEQLYPYVHYVEIRAVAKTVCFLLHLFPRPKVPEVFPEQLLHRLNDGADYTLALLRNKIVWPLPTHKDYPPDPDEYRIFRQINDSANEVLKNLVWETGQEFKEIYDLYAGAGNLSISLATSKRKVHAVETDPVAAGFGERQAKKVGLDSFFTYHRMPAENFVLTIKLKGLVLLDPPRSGCRPLLEKADMQQCSKILYVSCNMSSLETDLNLLRTAGFIPEKGWFLDMFPQTDHSESIVLLKNSNLMQK